jgi:hypothetical protein
MDETSPGSTDSHVSTPLSLRPEMKRDIVTAHINSSPLDLLSNNFPIISHHITGQ